jgi:MFS family permease
MDTPTKDIKMTEVKPSKLDIEDGSIGDLDESEKFLMDHNISPEYLQTLLADDAKLRKLVRKVDLRILPLLAGTFMMQFIDKQALSYAAVFDLFTDTNITQTQYSWFGSMFYFAYLVAEYPWTALAQRTRMGKVVAGCIVSWGAVLMVTAASGNFGGLAACRFFLGFFEAPITPCFMMIVGMWVSLHLPQLLIRRALCLTS